jgi:hypothetical protein
MAKAISGRIECDSDETIAIDDSHEQCSSDRRSLRKYVDELLAELAQVKQDAERYRWLRDCKGGQVVIDSTGYEGRTEELWPTRRGDDLDAAIDAARATDSAPDEHGCKKCGFREYEPGGLVICSSTDCPQRTDGAP